MYFKSFLLASLILAFLGSSRCNDLILGASANNTLAYETRVQLPAIIFVKRVKSHFYSVPVNSTATIKGIRAIDLLNSSGQASVTTGGIGSTYVNIKMKSDKSKALDYSIQIFT